MPHILIVDDEPDLRDLLSQILGNMGHTCDLAASGEEGCRRVADREYDLIITDVRMSGMSGLDFLRAIQPSVDSRTPCMIITAFGDDVALAVEAIRVGACNFISKPFEIGTIQEAVDRALNLRHAYRFRRNYKDYLEERLREKEEELRATYDGTLSALAAMIEGKDLTATDTETLEHCERVKSYCVLLARRMGVPERDIPDIRLGATLHDIGKYRVPDAILAKRGPLDDEEWVEMRKHPTYGVEFVRRVPFLKGAEAIVGNHHERYDGGGYPRGLAGDEIPLAARIFSVVDAFDAICEKRCYKDAQSPELALRELKRCAGTQFDPAVVDAFEACFEEMLEIQQRSRVEGPAPAPERGRLGVVSHAADPRPRRVASS